MMPGGSDPPQGSGVAVYHSCRRVVSVTAIVVISQRGSYDVRKPRGLNGRLAIAALSVTEKAPERSGKLT